MKHLHFISVMSGAFVGLLSAILGSWSLALETLGIVMLLDYATGLILAGIFHKSPKSRGGALESKAAFKGLVRKVGIIIFVIAFHQLDRLTGKTFFRDGVAWAFFVEEFISVVENLGLMDLPMPKFVLQAVEWLRTKSNSLTIPGTDKPPDEEDSPQIAGATEADGASWTPPPTEDGTRGVIILPAEDPEDISGLKIEEVFGVDQGEDA